MNLLSIIIELIVCLVFTIILEYVPIVKCLKVKKIYFIATNVLTNLLANIAVIIFDILNKKVSMPINRLQVMIIVEILVIVTEIILYKLYLKKKRHKKNYYLYKNILITIFSNAFSFLLGGFIIEKFIYWFRV